jgi:hypothetical protein
MADDLEAEERDYLVKLLARRYTELLHEQHHAATRAYKDGLRHEVELTERLKAKLEARK